MLSLLLAAALAWAQDPAPAGSTPPASPPPTPAPSGTTPATTPATPPPATPAAPADAPQAPVLRTEAPPTVVLFPIRAANLGASEVRAAEVLFRRRYETATEKATISEDQVRAAVTASDDKGLFAACEALHCTRWITVDLVRLDREIYVTILERDATAAVTQKVEAVAQGLDGLAPVFDRAARALAANLPYDRVPASRGYSTSTLPSGSSGSAPSSSVEPPTYTVRRKVRHGFPGFKFGIHGPLWPNFGLSLSHAFTWRKESDQKFFELDVGMTLPLMLTDDRTFGMVYGEVALGHVFGSGGTAPFVGAGFGPRVGGYDDFGVGIGAFGEAGLLFGRKTNSRAYLQLKVGGDGFTGSPAYVISYMGIEGGVGF